MDNSSHAAWMGMFTLKCAGAGADAKRDSIHKSRVIGVHTSGHIRRWCVRETDSYNDQMSWWVSLIHCEWKANVLSRVLDISRIKFVYPLNPPYLLVE